MTNPPSTPDGTIPEPPSGAPNPAESSPTWGTPAAPAGGPQAQYPPPGQAQLPPQGQAQYPPAAASAVKNPLLKRILVIVLILIAGFAVRSFMNRSMVDSMNVGDCVKKQGTDGIAVVACTDSTAEFKILKIVPGTTDDSQCPAETTITYTEQAKAGQTSSKDRMVCLTTK